MSITHTYSNHVYLVESVLVPWFGNSWQFRSQPENYKTLRHSVWKFKFHQFLNCRTVVR